MGRARCRATLSRNLRRSGDFISIYHPAFSNTRKTFSNVGRIFELSLLIFLMQRSAETKERQLSKSVLRGAKTPEGERGVCRYRERGVDRVRKTDKKHTHTHTHRDTHTRKHTSTLTRTRARIRTHARTHATELEPMAMWVLQLCG